MAQLFMTVQNLDNDTKYLDLAYNKDDPYAMVSVNQYFELHGKKLWKAEPNTLMLKLEEKLLCLQLS